MEFDMGRAWNDATARFGANFSLLAILGGVFFFIPSLVMFIALPDVMGTLMSPNAWTRPTWKRSWPISAARSSASMP